MRERLAHLLVERLTCMVRLLMQSLPTSLLVLGSVVFPGMVAWAVDNDFLGPTAADCAPHKLTCCIYRALVAVVWASCCVSLPPAVYGLPVMADA